MYAGVGVVSQFGPDVFGPNDLCPAVLGCQATVSIQQQVRRKVSPRPVY